MRKLLGFILGAALGLTTITFAQIGPPNGSGNTYNITNNPGGGATNVQYNTGSAFGGEAAFAYVAATNTLTVENVVITGSISGGGDNPFDQDLNTDSVVQFAGVGIGTPGVSGQFNFGEAEAGGPVLAIIGADDDVGISMVPSGALRINATESVELLGGYQGVSSGGVRLKAQNDNVEVGSISLGAGVLGGNFSVLTYEADGTTQLGGIAIGGDGSAGIYGSGFTPVQLGGIAGPFWNFNMDSSTEFPGDLLVAGGIYVSGGLLTRHIGNLTISTTASGNIDVVPFGDFNVTAVQAAFSGNVEALTFVGPLQVPVTAVASLPTCDGGAEGTMRGVNNALLPAALAIVAGGGAVHVPVYCDGTNWRVM